METPEIDYLSKDYASFRQLMLDHLAQSVPDWNEPSEADLGNVIVEVLAYAADYLSYYQDAVATEAYLGTARLRPSIKRHVRLLDYVLHEGCNARVWVQVEVSAPLMLPWGTQLLTYVAKLADNARISPTSTDYQVALQQQPKVFETLHDAYLSPAHNQIDLYAEEDEETTLPSGCTGAILCDPGRAPQSGLRLQSGDVLIFEEIKNASTGTAMGLDPTRRHAVRLTGVKNGNKASQTVLYVSWAEEDALPFPLRVSVRQQGEMITGISVARGNIILADHGLTMRHEALPAILPDQRYRPYLHNPALAYATKYVHTQARTLPACAALAQDAESALPVISLFQYGRTQPLAIERTQVPALHNPDASGALRRQLATQGVVLSQQVTMRAVHGIGWELHDTLQRRHWLITSGEKHLHFTGFKEWTLQRDLLSSSALACDYTVDMEDDRRARLRFGTGQQGRQPAPGDRFLATYRVGGGEVGNVRADTIAHIVTTDEHITNVRNPLAAVGGMNPASIEEARLNAPYTFKVQQSCITEADYAVIAMQHPQVTNAVVRMREVGNWPTICLYVQRSQGRALDAAFVAELTRFMEAFRVAGHEIEIRGPRFVGLLIELHVFLATRAAQSIVSSALTCAFSTNPGGFFYPANFTFGQSVYQSQVIAQAMNTPGVARVEVEQFRRVDTPTPRCVEQVPIQPLEIARLDNNTAAPYNGLIHFHIEREV